MKDRKGDIHWARVDHMQRPIVRRQGRSRSIDVLWNPTIGRAVYNAGIRIVDKNSLASGGGHACSTGKAVLLTSSTKLIYFFRCIHASLYGYPMGRYKWVYVTSVSSSKRNKFISPITRVHSNSLFALSSDRE